MAGAAGVTIGVAIFRVALEFSSPPDEQVGHWCALLVLVVGLAVAAALVASPTSP